MIFSICSDEDFGFHTIPSDDPNDVTDCLRRRTPNNLIRINALKQVAIFVLCCLLVAVAITSVSGLCCTSIMLPLQPPASSKSFLLHCLILYICWTFCLFTEHVDTSLISICFLFSLLFMFWCWIWQGGVECKQKLQFTLVKFVL